MKSYRYTSFSGPSGLHTRLEGRKLIQIHWCFENVSVPFSTPDENEEFMPTNSNFILKLDLMLQWAKQRLVAAEGHGDNDLQTSLMFVRGSTHCNNDSAMSNWLSVLEESCYGEDIPDPATWPFPEGFNPRWQMELKAVLRPLWLSHPLQYTTWDVILFPSLSHFTQKETHMHL